MGNRAGVQESSSHSRCTVKRGGSGVTSCAAESPGQPRPGALPALSLADGRWKGARRSGEISGNKSGGSSKKGGDAGEQPAMAVSKQECVCMSEQWP